MWEYNYGPNYPNPNDELIHYGVVGMKWGKRTARPSSGYKSDVTSDIEFRKNYRTAKVNKYSKSSKRVTRLKNKQSDEFSGRREKTINKLETKRINKKNKQQALVNRHAKALERSKADDAKIDKYRKSKSDFENIARDILVGDVGTRVMADLDSKGVSKGKTAAISILSAYADYATAGGITNEMTYRKYYA